MRRTDDPMMLEFVLENDMLHSDTELDTNKNNIVDADEKVVVPGEEFDISEMIAMQKDAWEGPVTDPEVTTDQWGTWISGYAPIYDANGNTVAIAGVDIDAMQFLELSKKIIPQQAFAAMLLIIVCIIGYIFYLVTKRYFDAEKREALTDYSADLEHKVQKRTAELEQAKIDLENKVVNRTQELSQKLTEVKDLNELMVGRELKMKELKDEIDRLKKS